VVRPDPLRGLLRIETWSRRRPGALAPSAGSASDRRSPSRPFGRAGGGRRRGRRPGSPARRRVSGQQPQRPLRLRLRDGLRPAGFGDHRVLLVAVVADDQIDIAARARRHRAPRGVQHDVPVDHRSEQRATNDKRVAPRVLVVNDCRPRDGIGQSAGTQIPPSGLSLRRCPRPGRCRTSRRERSRRCPAGRGRPPRGDHQQGYRARARGLPEQRDVLRFTAEAGDVVADPLQRGDLVEQPAIGWRSPPMSRKPSAATR
jgi:hypothetical protein